METRANLKEDSTAAPEARMPGVGVGVGVDAGPTTLEAFFLAGGLPAVEVRACPVEHCAFCRSRLAEAA
jgi:hypothetical protein